MSSVHFNFLNTFYSITFIFHEFFPFFWVLFCTNIIYCCNSLISHFSPPEQFNLASYVHHGLTYLFLTFFKHFSFPPKHFCFPIFFFSTLSLLMCYDPCLPFSSHNYILCNLSSHSLTSSVQGVHIIPYAFGSSI